MLAHLFIDEGRPAKKGVRVARVVVLVAAFAFLIGIAAWAMVDGWRQSSWGERAAVIRESGVDVVRNAQHEERPYVFHVTYAYEVGGKAVVSYVYRKDYSGTDDAAEAYGLARAYAAGKRVVCRVNPADVSEAVLEVERPWLPLGFGVGIVGIVGFMVPWYFVPQWRGTRFPKSDRTERIAAGVIALGAAGWLIGMYGVGVVRTALAAGWPAVPCVVRDSAVATHEVQGEHHVTLYRADVLYEYEVGGETYRSNRLNFTETAAPFWPYGKRRVVKAYAAGTRTTCRVKPGEPEEAVLTVGVRPSVFGAVLPVGFIGLGVMGMWKGKAVAQVGPRGVRWGWGGVLAGCALVLWAAAAGAVADWRSGQAAGVEVGVTAVIGVVTVLVMRKYWRVVNGKG